MYNEKKSQIHEQSSVNSEQSSVNSEQSSISPEDLRQWIIASMGGDPEAQQTLNNFLNFKNDLERTNLPRRLDLRIMAFVGYAHETVCKSIPNNPFDKLYRILNSAFMALKSEKSK